MFQQHQGIVLRSYLRHKNTVSILDKVQGRIEGIPDTQRLCLGGLINYHGVVQKDYFVLQQVEQIAVPWILAQADLVFLHHILELCYFSTAIAASEPSLFTFLCSLYHQQNWSWLLYKKLFLAKLYLLLHIHLADAPAALLRLMRNMITESIDTVAQELIDLDMEKELDKWLQSCIERHPYRNHFKTIHFYTRMAAL